MNAEETLNEIFKKDAEIAALTRREAELDYEKTDLEYLIKILTATADILRNFAREENDEKLRNLALALEPQIGKLTTKRINCVRERAMARAERDALYRELKALAVPQ